MKRKLTMKETIVVASTLFGMFFGAGNLIFPVHLGQMAGSNSWPAIIGFCITAVTIPILAVAAIGNTHSDDLLHLSSKVSGWYGRLFTAVLYLTIGPFFAIPRCASVSFTTGIAPVVGDSHFRLWQLIFTFIFFGFVMYFSLRPGKITTWIGRVINPLFLVFLAILIVVALINPGAPVSEVAPVEEYQSGALFNGIIEGYGTMDAIAGLAFGIVIINVVRDLGVDKDSDVARETLKAGVFTGILMVVIYMLTIIMGAQSRGLFDLSDNGGIALTQISGPLPGRYRKRRARADHHVRLPQDSDRTRHKLRRDVRKARPGQAQLQRLGDVLHAVLVHRFERGTHSHHHLRRACADAALSARDGAHHHGALREGFRQEQIRIRMGFARSFHPGGIRLLQDPA